MSNLTLRILTGIVGAPLVIAFLYIGGVPLMVLMVLVCGIAQYELFRMAEATSIRPFYWTLALVPLIVLRSMIPGAEWMILAAIILLVGALPLMKRNTTPLQSLSVSLLGLVYPTLALSFLLELRLARGPEVDDAGAFALTMGTLVMIWATDTFAYFSGRAFGRHPLAPSVSPKKTWEGSIGGALGALGIGILIKLTVLTFVPWLHLLVVAFICGVVSQLGDLAESKIKRSVGVKDSGNILPGHGGILDRVDALLLATPLVYLYLAYVARLFA